MAEPQMTLIDRLNLLLTLEYVQDKLYRRALETDVLPASYRRVFQQIGLQETQHVRLLRIVLADGAAERPKTDFTAGGRHPDVFEKFNTFLKVSREIEELSVAAYKAQLPAFRDQPGILKAVMRMHTVEARHAAEVRRILGQKAWDGAFDQPLDDAGISAALNSFLPGR